LLMIMIMGTTLIIKSKPLLFARGTDDHEKGYHPSVLKKMRSWGKDSQRAINCKVAS
jgi:hypothetical protein